MYVCIGQKACKFQCFTLTSVQTAAKPTGFNFYILSLNGKIQTSLKKKKKQQKNKTLKKYIEHQKL